MGFVVRNERARRAELRVGFEVGIVRGIKLRRDGFETRLVNKKMQVRRPKVVPFLGIQ